MNNQQFEHLVHNLQDVMRCPHCSSTYSLEDIHYLGQLETMTFLHMRCHGCKTPVFASVALTNSDGDIIPADIVAEDIALADSPAIMEQDLADLGFEHRVMEDELMAELPLDRGIPVQDVTAEQVIGSLTPISYDNVLDAHEYLKAFDGDFSKAWKA
ncbi:MAG: hypothetical protein V1826_02770 [bacterium]